MTSGAGVTYQSGTMPWAWRLHDNDDNHSQSFIGLLSPQQQQQHSGVWTIGSVMTTMMMTVFGLLPSQTTAPDISLQRTTIAASAHPTPVTVRVYRLSGRVSKVEVRVIRVRVIIVMC